MSNKCLILRISVRKFVSKRIWNLQYIFESPESTDNFIFTVFWPEIFPKHNLVMFLLYWLSIWWLLWNFASFSWFLYVFWQFWEIDIAEKLGSPTLGFDFISYEETVKEVNTLKARKVSQRANIPEKLSKKM